MPKQFKKPKRDDGVILFIKNIPNDVKAKFKAWCARRELTMTDAIIEYMREMALQDMKGSEQ